MGKSVIINESTSIEGQHAFEVDVLSYYDSEEGIYYCIAPALDVVGAGKTEKEASASFEIVLDEFIKSTGHKHSTEKELKRMGWEFSDEMQKRIVTKSPTISDLKKNPDWSEIWSKNPHIASRKLELAF